MAIDLKKRGFVSHVIGVDNNNLHVNTAKQLGFIDEIDTLENAVDRSDLIIVSIPVDATVKVLPSILDRITGQIVTDVCSTKASIVECIKNHPKRRNFVATHPMAGTEFSGPWAAIPDLFDGKAAIICDQEESSSKALELILKMYDILNMRVIYMNSVDHDVHAAYVSHISHISSFALALTVLEKEKDEKQIFNMASGGFDSTVRLAKSSADMWTPIFLENNTNVLTVLDTYIEKLQLFRSYIENQDKGSLKNLIQESNRIKRILKKT
jgi:prephenate dehydrogenase